MAVCHGRVGVRSDDIVRRCYSHDYGLFCACDLFKLVKLSFLRHTIFCDLFNFFLSYIYMSGILFYGKDWK